MHTGIFVGRNNELNILNNILSEANAGYGNVVLVDGEPGSGKSTLVNKFLSLLENNTNYIIADSECVDKEGINAYLPFKEILVKINSSDFEKNTESDKKQKVDKLKSFVYQAGSSWVNLIPIIGNIASVGLETFKSYKDVYGTKPHEEIKGEAEIQQTFEKEFRKIAQNKTLIVLFDDLQWADNSSLNLLFSLSRSIRKNPFRILLIGTYRPSDIKIGKNKISEKGENIIIRHPLSDKLNELKNYTKTDLTTKTERKWFHEISVSQFTNSDIQQLVNTKFPKNSFSIDFYNRLFDITQGHALFVNEILQNLVEQNIIFQNNLGDFTVKTIELSKLPTSVNGVIAERVERLDKELRKIISYASIDGQEVTVQILEKLLKIDELDLLDYIEELNKKHGLLIEQNPKKINNQLFDLYSFTHTLVHKYVYENLDASRRRALHRKIAEIIKEIYGENISKDEDLKKRYDLHIQIGQGLIDGITLKINNLSQNSTTDEITTKELDFSLLDTIKNVILSAKISFEQYAISECLDNIDKALAFILSAPVSIETHLLNFEALKIKIDALHWQGKYQKAYNYTEKLFHLAQLSNKDDKLAIAYSLTAKCLESLGNYEKSIDFYLKALDINKNLSETEYADNLNSLGYVKVRYGNYDEAIKYFETAKHIFEKYKNQEKQAESIMNIGYSHKMYGDYEKSITFYGKALLIFERLQIKRRISDCYNSIGLCTNWKGEYANAISFFEMSLQIDNEINDIVNRANHLNNIGLAKENLGDYKSAISYYQQTLEIDRSLGDKVKIAISYSNIGDCYTRQGSDYTKALEYHQKALDIYQELNDKINIAYSYQNIGEVHRNQYNSDLAYEYFNKSLEINKQIGDIKSIANDYINIANVLMLKNEYQKSIEFTIKAIEHFEKSNDKIGLAVIYNNLSSAYQMNNNYEKAFYYINKSIEINKSVNDKIALKRNYTILGNLNEDLAKYNDAIRAFENGLKLSKELNFVEDIASFHNKLGISYANQENTQQAINHYNQAILYNKQIKDFESVIINQNNIANLYLDKNEYNEAFKLYENNLVIAQNNGFISQIADNYNNIGYIFSHQNNLDKAINNYKNAIGYYLQDKNYEGIKRNYINISMIYEDLEQLDKAIFNMLQIVEVFSESGQYDELADTFHSIGILNYKIDNFEDAITYYNKAYELYQKIDDQFGLSNCYYNKALIYKYQEKYEIANNNFIEAKKILTLINEDITEVEEQLSKIKPYLIKTKNNDKPNKPKLI